MTCGFYSSFFGILSNGQVKYFTTKRRYVPRGPFSIIAKLPSVFEPVLVSVYETDDLLRMTAGSAQVSLHRDEVHHFQGIRERRLDDLSV
jgi:hypothetical protein